MLEKEIEEYLVRKVRSEITGALCWKFVSPGHAGVPDRIILLPSGDCVFVELKRPGERPRLLQTACIEQMRKAGQRVMVCDSKESIDRLIADLQEEYRDV